MFTNTDGGKLIVAHSIMNPINPDKVKLHLSQEPIKN